MEDLLPSCGALLAGIVVEVEELVGDRVELAVEAFLVGVDEVVIE